MENNRNVVGVVYSFTIHEAVLKKNVKCRVDVGSIWGRCGRGWKNIYNKMRRRRGFKLEWRKYNYDNEIV